MSEFETSNIDTTSDSITTEPELIPSHEPTPAPEVIPTPAPQVIPTPAPEVIPTPAPEVIPTTTPEVIPTTTPTPAPNHLSKLLSKLIPTLRPTQEPTPATTPEDTPAITPAPISENTDAKSFIYDSEPLAGIVSNIIEQTLVDLVKKSLENEEMKKQISISLTSEHISIINNIISLTPNTLTDIEKSAVEIIKDGKIDSKDVPNLVVIIQTIYQFIYSLKIEKFDTQKRAYITATTLKYILHLLVLERRIKIEEDKQGDFFTQTDLLIDSCTGLLSYSKTLQTKGCFKKLFFNNTLKIKSKDKV
jgi:hypothetical protein